MLAPKKVNQKVFDSRRHFMNLSVEAVKKLTIKYRVKPEDLIVIHDEMDLRLGIMRILKGG